MSSPFLPFLDAERARYREGAVKGIQDLLRYLGEDPEREGLRDTPERVLRAWERDWGAGYKSSASDPVTTFADGGSRYTQMITQRGIPVWSHCEHHLAPFFGTASVAYIPNASDQRIVGLSKVSRVIQRFSARLQVQERLTTQIADALQNLLLPEGLGVLLQCRHTCMESRGILQSGIVTTTTALRGSFLEDPSVREEFLRSAT